MLFNAGITLQTTGGYSSDLNGNVEILNKLIKRTCGALLASSGLSSSLWCYAVVHASALLNYLSYNHDKTMTAYEAWYGTKPHWDNFRVFGCDAYVVKELGSKNDLEKARRHRFLGWGASTTSIHYLETGTDKIKLARHVYFDDFSSSTPTSDLSPGAQIIRHEYTTTPSPVIEKVDSIADKNIKLTYPSNDPKSTSSISIPYHCVPFTPRFDNEVLNLHLRPDPNPFSSNQLYEHNVDFSSISTHPFGVFISYDDHFGLPFVKEIPTHSPWYVNLPAKFRRNIWILCISSSEPITAMSAYDALHHHVKVKKEILLPILLCKWEPTPRTRLHKLRATFDQVQYPNLCSG